MASPGTRLCTAIEADRGGEVDGCFACYDVGHRMASKTTTIDQNERSMAGLKEMETWGVPGTNPNPARTAKTRLPVYTLRSGAVCRRPSGQGARATELAPLPQQWAAVERNDLH